MCNLAPPGPPAGAGPGRLRAGSYAEPGVVGNLSARLTDYGSVSPRKTPRPGPKSSGAPSSAQQRLAAERAAAARARIADAQRRRRLFAVGGSVLAIIVVVGGLLIARLATGGNSAKSGTKATAAGSQLVTRISAVPQSVFDTIKTGSATGRPSAVNAPALTQKGKPLVLYIGAEYCPYCAAERWSVAAALSRFGSLHNVGQTASSPSDVYPSTPTLTFAGATYTSDYLAFTGKEIQGNQVVNGSYAPLEKLTASEQAVMDKYDAPPYQQTNGSIPFVDIGGKYLISGASYDPGVLKGKTHQQIAAALSDPNSPIARAVDGAANLVTAAICATTSQRPAAVCTSAGVTAAAAQLGSGK